MTKTVQDLAPVILKEIQSAKNILIHCHPHADPDSVCSALATRAALIQLGKRVTIIGGDTSVPEAFSHFPGFDSIVPKSFSEINASEYDLFLAQDSGSVEMVSRAVSPVIPATMKVIVIDHHVSNTRYGSINLVDAEYGATCQMLADLFELWNIKLDHDLALNLIMGMYTDTGGFRYENTTPSMLATVARLSVIAPDYYKSIEILDNARQPGFLAFQGIALSNIEMFLDGKLAISALPYELIQEKKLTAEDISTHTISNLLKSVIGWEVGVCMVELEKGKVKMSFRTRDPEKFNLSIIASRIGGGGHRAAAGANISGSIDDAKKAVVAAVAASL